MIRRVHAVIAAGLLTCAAMAQVSLDTVSVVAVKPLSQSGLSIARLDSVALRRDIAQSMADVIGRSAGVFVKSSGRATLSTVSFRGTAPSHTAVTWNGLPVNSPSLGMADFSLIPSYLIDSGRLLYGASSLADGTGGLGGAVALQSGVNWLGDGFSARYIQGLGSFKTFDEYLQAGWRGDKVAVMTRLSCASSRNDFRFVNRDRKENIYDDNHQIVSQYYPRQRNRNGQYSDLHLLQSVSYAPTAADRIDIDGWFTHSKRGLPLSTVDYNTDRAYRNEQRENSVRATASWHHRRGTANYGMVAGYAHTRLDYDYAFDPGTGQLNALTASRTTSNRFHFAATADRAFGDRWLVTARLSADRDAVSTTDLASLTGHTGYTKHRWDGAASVTARWRPVAPLTISAIAAVNSSGEDVAFTPALFAEYNIPGLQWLSVRASATRNHRFPTLNDLYFEPGGNPSLSPEKGFSYDAGIVIAPVGIGNLTVGGTANWFDSYIDGWIMWLPTAKGFFSPRNVRRVHSSGVELTARVSLPVNKVLLSVEATGTRTASVNVTKATAGDLSAGRQLPYVPLWSAAATLRAGWCGWEAAWHFAYYDSRLTMSASENSISGVLPRYVMNDASVGRGFKLLGVTVDAKLSVTNIFGVSYQTVATHPMPGRGCELFIGISL